MIIEYMAKYPTPEFSRREVNRAGAMFVNPNSTAQERDAALTIINYWRAAHNFPLNTFQMRLRDVAKRINPESLVTQRIKRLPIFFIANPKNLYICLMKFGIDQYNKPTPKPIVRSQTAFNYLAFSIVGFSGFFCRNFGIDPIDLSEGVGISCIAVNFLAIFFGAKPIENENPE